MSILKVQNNNKLENLSLCKKGHDKRNWKASKGNSLITG